MIYYTNILNFAVKRQAKCKVSNLIQTVHSFLMNPGESGKIISFVYLAGPTVQVRIIYYQTVTDQHLLEIYEND